MAMMRTLGVLACLAALAASPGAADEVSAGGDDVRGAVHVLCEALAARDDARVAEVVCLGVLGADVRARAEAAGLIADADSPTLVAAYDAAYLAALHAEFDGALAGGAMVSNVDTGAVDDSPGVGESTLASDPTIVVTAAGIVRADLRGRAHRLDIPVVRLGTRWCLDPITIQPHGL